MEDDGQERDENGCVPWCPVRLLDEQAGPRTSGGTPFRRVGMGYHGATGQPAVDGNHGDTGSASRYFPTFPGADPEPEDAVPFFYCAKSSRRERDQGLKGGADGGVSVDHNTHPT